MATLVLGAAGAAAGSFFGPQAAMTGFSVGVTLAGVLFPPKLGVQEKGKLDDLRITGSGYGQIIPAVYGKAAVGGNLIWSTDLIEHVSKKTAGAKGAPKQTTKSYTYSVSMWVMLCEGPIGQVGRVWAEDRLLYDPDGASGTVITLPDYLTLFLGDEDQLPWSVAETIEGVGAVPAYRGVCGLAFEDFDLSSWGNRIPVIKAEVQPI
jgi:hypothetical protein